MTLLALALAAAASAQSAWTPSVVWDAPSGTPVHAVAVAVDPATGDRMFVLDVGQRAWPYRPTLRYLRWDGGGYGAPVVLSRGLWLTDEPYMPAVATADGMDSLLVLSRAHQGGREVGTRTQLVDRETGAVLLTSDALRLDPAASQGRASIATDGLEAHACVTVYTASGDDVLVDHTAALAWRGAGEDHVVADTGTQDHCSLALRPDGTRVIAYHDGAGVQLLLEDTAGTLAAGFPLSLQPPGGDRYDTPSVAVRSLPEGDEVHAAFVLHDTAGYSVLHTACAPSATVSCSALSDWSAPVAVAAAQPRHPNPQLRVAADGVAYVAYATETAGGAKTVAVASRCPGAAFVDTGLVDDVGEQGFGVATDGTIENRAFLTSSSLTVDDDGGTVHLAWVRRSEGRSVAVEGWRDLASCE